MSDNNSQTPSVIPLRILLIGGLIGTGKSTLAENIRTKMNKSLTSTHVIVESFANALRDEYCMLKGLGDAKEFTARMRRDAEFRQSHRVGLCLLGAERRGQDPDYFVKSTWLRITSGIDPSICHRTLVIIDDWRYPNELEFLSREMGSSRVWTTRLSCPTWERIRRVPGLEKMAYSPTEHALDDCFGGDLAKTVQRMLWSPTYFDPGDAKAVSSHQTEVIHLKLALKIVRMFLDTVETFGAV